MSVAEIIKEQSFFKEVEQKCKSGGMSCATLFSCEDEETSKVTLILAALAMQYPTSQLMDENSAEYVRINNNAEIDVKVFPKGEKLLVDDSSEIVNESFVKSVNLPYKIFIINNVDVSTVEAQNKLLKILEEPPKGVFFLLSMKNEAQVLATIKSRCEIIKIKPFELEQIRKVCDNELAIVLGGGYIGKTLALEKNEKLDDIADFAVSLLCELKSSKDVIKYSKAFLDKADDVELILLIMSLALEDILKLKCESEELCKLKKYLSQIRQVETEYSISAIKEIGSLIANFRLRIQFNANLTVLIDNFLLKILEVKYLCK